MEIDNNFDYTNLEDPEIFQRLYKELIVCFSYYHAGNKLLKYFPKLQELFPKLKPKEILVLLTNGYKTHPKCVYCCTNNVHIRLQYRKLRIYCKNKKCRYEHTQKQLYKTNMERYGVKNTSQRKDVQKKIAKTCQHRYGFKTNLLCAETIKKSKQINLKKYGVEYSSQRVEVKEKAKQTNLKRYGVTNPAQKHYSKELLELFDNKISFEKELNKFGIMQFCKKYPITPSRVYVYIKKLNLSYTYKEYSTEAFIKNFLKKHNINFAHNERKQIKPLELDFYLPEHKVAIETCGIYWHSDKFKDKKYHQNKYNRCEEKGINLITLFEDEINKYPESIEKLLKLVLFDQRPHDINTGVLIEDEINKFLIQEQQLEVNLRFGLLPLYVKDGYKIKKHINPLLVEHVGPAQKHNIWDCGQVSIKQVF